MSYRWEYCRPKSDVVRSLAAELGISRLLAQLLVNRGLTESAAAEKFLHPSLDDLHDPRLMQDMDRVVARLKKAVAAREKILVYGDYDVDGITSTVILKRALEMLGAAVLHHIPKRLEEGYGLRSDVLRQAANKGVKVVVTVDSGIRAFEACETARGLDLDLIVTDHHLPAATLPSAYAVLNPKRSDCQYPDDDLAAVGVVFKLIDALFREAGREEVVPHFLKLVAIGTVADMVPLLGENRVIVSFGLRALSQPYNLGLQALLAGAGVGEDVTHLDIGFKVAPRINAFTRMGGAGELVDLFSLDDPASATAMVQEMNQRNAMRRRVEQEILQEIERLAAEKPKEFERRFLLVYGPEWHRGVIGNVAARLVEKYHRPVLVGSVSQQDCQCSGRSITGFHLLEALDHCSDLLTRFGGHSQAVGCTLPASNLEELSERLNHYTNQRLSSDHLVPRLRVDAPLQPEEISLKLFEEINRLAPHGVGNPVPVFSSEQVEVLQGPWVLKEKHLKLKARCNGNGVDAIWWRHGEAAASVAGSRHVDLVYSLSRDRYQGQEKLLITIKDLRSS